MEYKKRTAKVFSCRMQKEISQLLRTPEMEGCKGYILSVSDDDRLLDLVTVTFLWADKAVVFVNDTETMLEYAVKYHIKINSQYKMIGMKRGFDRDDFVTKRVSALLTFDLNS